MVGQRASLSGLIQKRLGLNTASNIIRNSWLAFRMPGVHFVAVKACDLRTYQRSGPEQCNEPDEVYANGPRPSQVTAVLDGPWLRE